MHPFFRKFSHWTSEKVGSPWAFVVAVVVILIWALLGPIYHFSENWQLMVNTGTTILTFLMVFLIQNTQNRDAQAVHLKLDEIIKAIDPARNDLIDIGRAWQGLLPHAAFVTPYRTEHRVLHRTTEQVKASRAFCNDRAEVVVKTGQEDDVPGLKPPVFDYVTVPA